MTGRARPGKALQELARRLGIMPEYVDMSGRARRASPDTTRALLRGMGFDAPTEEAARDWLDELAREERETILEPVRVVERDSSSAARVRVRLPPGLSTADVALTLTEERGHVWHARNERATRGATLVLPTRPPYGYHHLTATVRSGSKEWVAEQSLIVVPASCVSPDRLLGKGRKAMGIVANLYSIRREGDWGVGDLETLTQLVEWAAARGAAFVGINPLHTTFNRDGHVSPYAPISRLFRNPVYIDVERVPGFDSVRRPDVSALRAATWVDYDGVIDAKENALRALHAAFRTRANSQLRGGEYDDFVRTRDPELTRFATWMAIAEEGREPDWRRWPESMRNPENEAVVAFQRSHPEQIDFHRWLQFEIHRQLRDVAHRARLLGMRVGVYQDLAIGSSGGGSDAWYYPSLFVSNVSVGAPPDPYAATGQNWGFPPIDPRALRAQGYRYWVQLLRCAFENAGALRIDHILGLFRLFWIPAGMSGKDGAYVRYPARDLLGILALESERHNALVVGEDLGTVPAEVPRALKKWGILSSKVLLFERDARGYKQARRYPKLSLATADTHDMPPLAGFWTERDIDLRERVGLIQSPAVLRQEKVRRRRDKAALLRLTGLEPPAPYEEARFPRKLTGAIHDFLGVTPSYLVGLSFDDLIGELDPVNVPGVTQDTYPSWRRRTRKTMEEVSWSFEVDDTIRCEDRRSNG